jgi:hypothetical protein
MSPRGAALALLAGLSLVGIAQAAPPGSDPDWPCMQRLVPHLAPGTYWPGLVAPTAPSTDSALADVAAAVAPRDVSVTEGEAKLGAYADALPSAARAQALPALFAALVADADAERGVVISRIKDLYRRQRSLAQVVDQLDTTLRATPAEATQQRADIVERRNLLARGYLDTQRTMQYACQVPAQMEKTLGAYASFLQQKAATTAPPP